MNKLSNTSKMIRQLAKSGDTAEERIERLAAICGQLADEIVSLREQNATLRAAVLGVIDSRRKR